MKTDLSLSASAAEALVELLPITAALRPLGSGKPTLLAPGQAGSAVVASFVGSRSADAAVVLTDRQFLEAAAGTDSPLVSITDVLRPALEAATAVLGAGVLSDARVEDAGTLFADADTQVFELNAAGAVKGWFAVRIRDNGTVGGAHAGGSAAGMAGKLGRINNVEMAMTVEIGRTRMSVRDVLDLEPGGVIELDRSAGAPADVLLNGRLIAHGEVVVVDQDYAVRITKILDVAEGNF